MIIEFSDAEALCLSQYFESDLPYYIGGLDILKIVIDSKDDNEYAENLKKYNLPQNTEKVDLKSKYVNTKKLVDIMSKIVDTVNKNLVDGTEESDVKLTIV